MKTSRINRFSIAAIVSLLSLLGSREPLRAQTTTPVHVRNVVLVHGGVVDGSGWEGVYKAPKKDGYRVTIVQNPTTSLADYVPATKSALAAQNGPGSLVGHSYRGGGGLRSTPGAQ